MEGKDPVVEIPANGRGGRDFVFDDIHGCFATVEQALEALDYDPGRDRLFSVGDLIDRAREAARHSIGSGRGSPPWCAATTNRACSTGCGWAHGWAAPEALGAGTPFHGGFR